MFGRVGSAARTAFEVFVTSSSNWSINRPYRLMQLMYSHSFSMDQIMTDGWFRSPLTWATIWSRQLLIRSSLISEP